MDKAELMQRIDECYYKSLAATNEAARQYYLNMKHHYEEQLNELNQPKVFIKGFFGKWHEVTFEKACEYFQNKIKRGCNFKYLAGEGFAMHFKGVTVEKILNHIK